MQNIDQSLICTRINDSLELQLILAAKKQTRPITIGQHAAAITQLEFRDGLPVVLHHPLTSLLSIMGGVVPCHLPLCPSSLGFATECYGSLHLIGSCSAQGCPSTAC